MLEAYRPIHLHCNKRCMCVRMRAVIEQPNYQAKHIKTHDRYTDQTLCQVFHLYIPLSLYLSLVFFLSTTATYSILFLFTHSIHPMIDRTSTEKMKHKEKKSTHSRLTFQMLYMCLHKQLLVLRWSIARLCVPILHTNVYNDDGMIKGNCFFFICSCDFSFPFCWCFFYWINKKPSKF